VSTQLSDGHQWQPVAVGSRPAAATRPPLWLEQRAGLELAELLTSPVYYGVGVPRGDGAPVLLVPGFLGSDDYLSVLYGWLRRIGYRPFGSGLVCIGRIDRLLARLLRRVEDVARAAGRPLVVIGHSLGGMLSCAVAHQRPDLVDHVVTLGTARAADAQEDASAPMVRAMADLLLGEGGRAWERVTEHGMLGRPLPDGLRLSCIYSRDDAVVDWTACLDDDPRTSLYEVRGTHTGLAWNAQVYRRLARVLALE
jgi:triacylglycerol lipase